MIQQSLSGPIARKNYNSKRYMQTYVWASQAAQWYRIHMQCRKFRFDPWVRKIPWRRKRQPTPVFLPGESNGRRSLVGYSPWDCTELGHDSATKQIPPPPVFIAALFTIARTWKQPKCSSTDEWVDVVHLHRGLLLSHKKE